MAQQTRPGPQRRLARSPESSVSWDLGGEDVPRGGKEPAATKLLRVIEKTRKGVLGLVNWRPSVISARPVVWWGGSGWPQKGQETRAACGGR